jgi:hypothetical protein
MSGDYYVTVEQYAEQIRNWAKFDKEYRRHKGLPPVDPNVVFKLARVAATYERLRWDMHTKRVSPGDRNRLDELADALQRFATELGLGKVDHDGWLPGDPGVYLAGYGPRNTLQPWHQHCMYDPREGL